MMLAIYVAAPEVENRRRSLATKQGTRRAMREGRYCNMAPKGYRNTRDARGRPTIMPSDDARHIRTAFLVAAREPGMAMEHIRLLLRKQGFKCSRNRFTQILKNPLYAGKMLIPAWQGEPEERVDGLHEAIIPYSLFPEVERTRFADARPGTTGPKQVLVEELELRGHLVCPCCFGQRRQEQLVTGSLSRSKTGRRTRTTTATRAAPGACGPTRRTMPSCGSSQACSRHRWCSTSPAMCSSI